MFSVYSELDSACWTIAGSNKVYRNLSAVHPNENGRICFCQWLWESLFGQKTNTNNFRLNPNLAVDCATLGFISTTSLIGKRPQYTASELCAHQQYQMCILREAITLWCGDSVASDSPQDGLFAVSCKWALLFNINTLDICRAAIWCCSRRSIRPLPLTTWMLRFVWKRWILLSWKHCCPVSNLATKKDAITITNARIMKREM